MFSNLSQNSILYILDLHSNPKVLTGPIEKVTGPRPKYNSLSPNMEMIVDIIAVINGERREFKGVPNSSLANFGEDAFIIAESKDILNSYINSMLQNSKSIVNNVDKHKKRIEEYEEALQELNPDIKASMENDKAIQSLQDRVDALQEGLQKILTIMTKNETPNT